MTAEFNVWLLLVGLVVGGGLTWLVIGELRRSDGDIGRDERGLEAAWIADQLADSDAPVTTEQAEAVLRLHQRYLVISLPPESEPDETLEIDRVEIAAAVATEVIDPRPTIEDVPGESATGPETEASDQVGGARPPARGSRQAG